MKQLNKILVIFILFIFLIPNFVLAFENIIKFQDSSSISKLELSKDIEKDSSDDNEGEKNAEKEHESEKEIDKDLFKMSFDILCFTSKVKNNFSFILLIEYSSLQLKIDFPPEV